MKTPEAITGAHGQATVEAVAGLALFLVAGVVAFQMMAVGHSASLADAAAQAAAVAVVNGRPAERAARRSLPSWAAGRIEFTRVGGSVRVTLGPPSVIGPVSDLLRVASTVRVHPGRTP